MEVEATVYMSERLDTSEMFQENLLIRLGVEICRKVESVVWKARDCGGRTELSDGNEVCFFDESFVYI